MMNHRLCAAIAVLVGLLLAAPASAETLRDAWREALAKNPQMAAATCEATASEQALQAVRAERYPSAALRGSYKVLSDEQSFRVDDSLVPGGGRFPYAQDEYASTEAILNAPLYTSGRTKFSILRSEANLTASQQQVRNTRQGLLLSVGEAYLAVLRTQRGMAVVEHDVITRQAHLTEVEKLVKQERLQKTDVLTAQVTLASAYQNRLRQQHRLEVVRATYNQRLGRPLMTQFQLEELAIPGLPQGFYALEQIAWQSRPEIIQLQAIAEARLLEAKRINAGNKPQISAVGSHYFEENQFQTPNGIASAAVVVDWRPFDGGRAKHAAQAENSRAMAAVRSLDDLRSRISLELLTSWNDRQEAFERREVALKAVQQSDENVRVLQLRFLQGLALQSELLDGQSRRTELTRDYYNATYDITLAELRLRYASGMLESSAF